MNARFDLTMTKPEFRRWIEAPERREKKFEWVEGRVVQMANVTRAHARIVANFVRALSARLDLDQWSVVSSDFNVEQAAFIRVPDVIVEPMGDDDKALSADNAVILVEVLSSSSIKTDFVDKLAEYTSLPTLEVYIIASQDEAACWHWQRQDDGTFPQTAGEVRGRDSVLELRARGFSLPLSELYRGTRAV